MSCEDVDAEPNCYDIWNQAPCIARPYCAFVNGQCYDRTIDLADMTCSEFTDEDSCAQNANRCIWNSDDGMCGSLPCANFASDVYLCQSQVNKKCHSLLVVSFPACRAPTLVGLLSLPGKHKVPFVVSC